MPRITALLALAVVTVVAAGIGNARAAPQPDSASVLIRHQVQHCRTWSVNGGPFKEAQALTLRRGGTITFLNNDVMPHRLIELAGSAVVMHNGSTMPMGARMHGAAKPGLMNYTGATTTTPGVYRFRTRAGEDYMAGFTTAGEDNILTMTVTVR